MNKNYECDICKDLAIPYTEKLINSNSKIFVEEHLRNCEDCKKYYNDINSNILNEKENEERKQKKEVDFLKKIRRNMNYLKIFLSTVIVVILFIVLSACIKYQKVNKIVDNAYNKIEYLKTLDNYKLTKKTTNINYVENATFETTANYYYKEGKYKIDLGNTVLYYEDNSYNKIYVFNDIKQIDYYTQNFVENKKGKIFEEFLEIISYKKELPGLFKLMLSVREERFNGIDCYVIRNGNDKNYKDIWIEKKTNLVLRIVEEEHLKYYRETTYMFVQNEVIDQDVSTSVLENEQYKEYTKEDVIYNATKEMTDILGN